MSSWNSCPVLFIIKNILNPYKKENATNTTYRNIPGLHETKTLKGKYRRLNYGSIKMCGGYLFL